MLNEASEMIDQNMRTKLRRFAIAALLVATFVLTLYIGLSRLILSSAHQTRLNSVFVRNIVYRDDVYWCLKCTSEGKRLGISLTLVSFDVEPIEGFRFQCFRVERLIETGMMEMPGNREHLDGACSAPLQAQANRINTADEHISTPYGEQKYSAAYGILVSPQSDQILVVWSDNVVQLIEASNGPFRGYAEEHIEWSHTNYDWRLPKLSMKPPYVTWVPGYRIWKSYTGETQVRDGKQSFLAVRRDCPSEVYVSRVDVLDKNGTVIFSYSP